MNRLRHSALARDEIEARVARAMERFPEVDAVFLFGSATSGRATRESDLDFGIVTEDRALGTRKLDLLTEFARQGLDNVDLAFLGDDDLVIRFEAVRPNRLVFSRESFDLGAYYSKALRQYFDFLPYLTTQRRALKRRLRGA